LGFVDPDPRLTGHLVEGLRVLGTLDDLSRVLAEQSPELAVIANPELSGRAVRAVAAACEAAGVRLRTVPAMSELPPGARVTMARVRDVRLEDLLGRASCRRRMTRWGCSCTAAACWSPVREARSAPSWRARRRASRPHRSCSWIMPRTGSTSSSASCSTAASVLPVHAVVADLRDAAGVEGVFAAHRPEVVLHAAAHKHVPLLEDSPREAVLNNVGGTRHLVEASARHGVAHFVLVSTDKAVHPSSVMGATKRVCERLVQAASVAGGGRYCAVRFGNVLGSEGSVVPLFQRQLERGGPLTVTHPDATRYFMTIPEAVRLVLQAGGDGPRRRGVPARHGRAREGGRPGAVAHPARGAARGRGPRDRLHGTASG
jgi:FlaA1/EpsC-like NDP-sugar epimerase